MVIYVKQALSINITKKEGSKINSPGFGKGVHSLTGKTMM